METFKLALVTGATSGIGEALCKLLAAKGIDLLITGRNVEALNRLTHMLQQHVKVVAFPADLSKDRSIVVEKIKEYKPDLVINNAGFGIYGTALSHPVSEEMEILNVNANAVLELTLEAAKTMIQHKQHGVIMNVASAGAFVVFPYSAIYAASKAFVVNASLALDSEMESSGVRVLVSCPGMVDTQFNSRAARSVQKPHSIAMSSEHAAEQIWWQIQKRKPCHIFDWKTRWGIYLSKLFPKKTIAHLLRNIIARRIQ